MTREEFLFLMAHMPEGVEPWEWMIGRGIIEELPSGDVHLNEDFKQALIDHINSNPTLFAKFFPEYIEGESPQSEASAS
jgi:hypothetical protein